MFLFVFVAVKTFKHILYHLKLYQNTWWTFYTPVQLYCVNQTITTQQARTQATTISFHFLTFFLESTIFYNCPTFFLESTISYHFPTFFLESTLPLVVFHLLHRSPGLPTVRSHLTYIQLLRSLRIGRKHLWVCYMKCGWVKTENVFGECEAGWKYRVVFLTGPPKKLKYVKPRLGVSTLT